MSWEAVSWVIDHSEARDHDRMVLFLIANEVDSEGLDGHPSQRRLARGCRFSQTEARRCILRLEGAGEIVVKRPEKPAPGRFSRYALTMGRDPVELAALLGWPEPKLDPAIRGRWEQLALDTATQDARYAEDAYVPKPHTRPVASMPEWLNRNVPNPDSGAVPNPTEPSMEGADPLTLTSDKPEDEKKGTEAVLAADRQAATEAAPMPPGLRDRLHGAVDVAKPHISTGATGEEVEALPERPPPSEPEVCPVCEHPWHDGERCEATEGEAACICRWPEDRTPPDRWAERKDLE